MRRRPPWLRAPPLPLRRPALLALMALAAAFTSHGQPQASSAGDGESVEFILGPGEMQHDLHVTTVPLLDPFCRSGAADGAARCHHQLGCLQRCQQPERMECVCAGGILGGLAVACLAGFAVLRLRRRSARRKTVAAQPDQGKEATDLTLSLDDTAASLSSPPLLPPGKAPPKDSLLTSTYSESALDSDQLLSYISTCLTTNGTASRFDGPASGVPASLPAEVRRWEVQWDQLQLLRRIGKGSWGRVSCLLRSPCVC